MSRAPGAAALAWRAASCSGGFAGCGGGLPLLHPAQTLPVGDVRAAAGSAGTSPSATWRRGAQRRPARRQRRRPPTRARTHFAKGALVPPRSARASRPSAARASGSGWQFEGGLVYTGRALRVDVRRRSTCPTTGRCPWVSGDRRRCTGTRRDGARPNVSLGQLHGWGADVPLLVGYESPGGLYLLWAGARGGWEHIDISDLTSEPKAVTFGSPPIGASATRLWAGGLLGLAVASGTCTWLSSSTPPTEDQGKLQPDDRAGSRASRWRRRRRSGGTSEGASPRSLTGLRRAATPGPMSITYGSIRQFSKIVKQLDRWLEKAVAHAKAKSFDPGSCSSGAPRAGPVPARPPVPVGVRHREVRRGPPRRQGSPQAPRHRADIEELRARIKSCADYLDTYQGGRPRRRRDAPRDAPLPRGQVPAGRDYLLEMAQPNFYFHASHAYAILRHNGVSLGKMDFLARSPRTRREGRPEVVARPPPF